MAYVRHRTVAVQYLRVIMARRAQHLQRGLARSVPDTTAPAAVHLQPRRRPVTDVSAVKHVARLHVDTTAPAAVHLQPRRRPVTDVSVVKHVAKSRRDTMARRAQHLQHQINVRQTVTVRPAPALPVFRRAAVYRSPIPVPTQQRPAQHPRHRHVQITLRV